MQTHFRHVALVGKYNSPNSQELLASIAEFLTKNNIRVSIDRQSALDAGLEEKFPCLEIAEIGEQCDLLVVAGGDGTMLRIARKMAKFNIPLVGINQGRLGFITDIPPDVHQEALMQILSGSYKEDTRSMIDGQVWRDDSLTYSAQALNEVVINRVSTEGMVDVSVEVDQTFVANLRADGVMIATPTGSTAYALSAGGPILYPGIKGWILVPIAAHTLSNRPIVLPDDGVVTLKVASDYKSSVSFDSQSYAGLVREDRVVLKAAEQQVRFLHPAEWSFYKTLRKKLRWYAE